MMTAAQIRQQVEATREVARLDFRARAAAAAASGDTLAIETIVRESLLMPSGEGLVEVDRALAEREREIAELDEAERRSKLEGRIWEESARRVAAIEKAETALAALIEALAEAESSRQAIARLAAAIPVQLPSPLAQSESDLTNSRFLCAALARLGHPCRYGGLTIPGALTAGAEGSWSAATRRVVERFASSITAQDDDNA